MAQLVATVVYDWALAKHGQRDSCVLPATDLRSKNPESAGDR